MTPTLRDLLDGHIRQTFRRTPGTADAIAREVAAVLAAGRPLHDWLLVRRVGDRHTVTWYDNREAAFRALGMAEALAVEAHRAGRGLLAENVPRLVPVTALLEGIDRAGAAALPDVKEA